jgi:hypothetical protein
MDNMMELLQGDEIVINKSVRTSAAGTFENG